MLTVLGAVVVIDAAPAFAGTTITVNSTADVATNYGACGNGGTSPQNPAAVSLREAVCVVNNAGGTATININAGHYVLLNGDLQPGLNQGQNITIAGAGAANTIIDGNQTSRIFDIDDHTLGGITVSINGLTLTNGFDSNWGGAAIIDGGDTQPNPDVLTINNSVISDNVAHGSSQPGGGVAMDGGNLTISNTTISGNVSQTEGSGVWYLQQGGLAGTVHIANSVFSGNDEQNIGTNGFIGGALTLEGSSATYSVAGTRFLNNSDTTNADQIAAGAAIFASTGTLTATGNTFVGNSATGTGTSGTPATGAVLYTGGTATLHYNRIAGNTSTSGIDVTNTSAQGSIDANDNWWGCNAGPGNSGCGTTGTGVTTPNWLELTAAASPSTVTGPNGSSTITAALTSDNSGTSVAGTNLTGLDGTAVSFADPAGDATVTTTPGTHTASMASGQASIDYHSNNTGGPDPVAVTLDAQTVSAALTVNLPTQITSASTAKLKYGSADSFTVTSIGYPTPALTYTGTLPAGLGFQDNGDGTATISGTATSGGTYPIQVTADNGKGSTDSQTLTISVGQPPAFTSPATATFQVGVPGTFDITTSGVPTVASISESGSLPTGLTYTDRGDGTAALSGTPVGPGGPKTVTLSAGNGVSPDATQNLDVVVQQAPTVTQNPADNTVAPGDSVTFTAAASGYPAPTVQWQKSVDGGATFADITGAMGTSYTLVAAAADDRAQFRAVFTNAVDSATTQAATLRVGTAPSFTSADHAAFLAGTPGSFTVNVAGVPNATITETGSLPGSLSFADNGDNTATISGTPTTGEAGSYVLTLAASNGFSPDATQTFTLQVDTAPAITSADHTTFAVGQPGNFTVTTDPGYPTGTVITETGALPAGVSFTDKGDGTATLAGTPTPGSGGTYSFSIRATADGGSSPSTSQSFALTVTEPPHFTSAAATTFTVGDPGNFTVSTTPGFPTATTLAATGVPDGLTFTDHGDGTATLAGTPTVGQGGVYSVFLTASNGTSPGASQWFTLTVNEAPHITSADHTAFRQDSAGSFTVTTAKDWPTSTTLTIGSGALPAGVTFNDNGDGTATLAGTPTVNGSYVLSITASNGVSPNDTQTFTLTVDNPPAISSGDHITFTAGSSGTFEVTTTPGTPASTTLSESGALPDGVTFTDNGDGTATLAGTPVPGTGGRHAFTITASNGITPDATQPFTLVVFEAPAITSVDNGTATIGSPVSITVTTRGYPTPAITEIGNLPDGVAFTDRGDGTASLSGTPADGSVGGYVLHFTADNAIGIAAVQDYALVVSKARQTITVTSDNPVTGVVDGSYTPTATSDSGLPVAVTIDPAATSVCSFDGTTVHFEHQGNCVVDFDQAGDADYLEAQRQQQSIAISTAMTTTAVTPSVVQPVFGQPLQATATVAAPGRTPAGTVQFRVDGVAIGSPVTLAAGQAISGDLADATNPLHPGAHDITAVFVPADATSLAGSSGTSTVAVAQAATTTVVQVTRRAVLASVSAVTPGAGTPTGMVRFTVGGHRIGHARLVDGVARLSRVIASGATRQVAAAYSGDRDFTGSSASMARHDPTITATVTSRQPKSPSGWYRTPVTIRFSCATNGAPLVHRCPSPVHVTRSGAGLSVTRTIAATDGGSATVAVSGIDIDQVAPGVRIGGVRDGKVYPGQAPKPTCVGRDRLSGVASCVLRTRTHHGVTRVVARVVDQAGNARATAVRYRVLGIYLDGARYQRGGFNVRVGHAYTLIARSVRRPRLYDAAVSPGLPAPADQLFHRAGRHRWALGVTIDPAMRSHPLWNLGVKIGRRLHVVKLRVPQFRG